MRIASTLALLLLLPAASTLHATPQSSPAFTPIPGVRELTGRLVARPLQAPEPDSDDAAAVEHLRRAALDALARHVTAAYVPETDETILRVTPGDEERVARALLATGGFEYVEPDWGVYPAECPDDPLLGHQWHHAPQRMNTCAGWDIEKGSPSVVVSMVDTGVRTTHADLMAHRANGYNWEDKLYESQGGDVEDLVGHGTRVNGCLAAAADNGVGGAGVGWSIRHRMLRVTNDPNGFTTLSEVTAAVRFLAHTGNRVVSVSYSGVDTQTVQTAANFTRLRGSLLVWAAGNQDTVLTGERDDELIVVGASDRWDLRAGFSNSGPFVDLFAPGAAILTTAGTGDLDYTVANGTSYAAPFTAGLLGLVWTVDPALTPDEAEDLLRLGCDDLGAPGEDDTYGFGRIEVQRTLRAALLHETLFRDDFESGDFATGGWVVIGDALITNEAGRRGVLGARVRMDGVIERAIDTTGYHSIRVSYSRRTKNYGPLEAGYVEWWDGNTWHELESTRDNRWKFRSHTLPPAAAHNTAFKIRFRSRGDQLAERVDVDDVRVTGVR